MNHLIKISSLCCACLASGVLSMLAELPSAELPQTESKPTPTPALAAGSCYFNMDGKPSFVFSRNPTGMDTKSFGAHFYWSKTAGSRVARIHVTVGFGEGIDASGNVDPRWLAKWDAIFDKAQAEGILLIPVFGVWAPWSLDAHKFGLRGWEANLLNVEKGGPGNKPVELLQPGTDLNIVWMKWLKQLAEHWSVRTNILAWEIFSEMDNISGRTENDALSFNTQASEIIRGVDALNRPIMSSSVSEWPLLFASPAIDIIQIHPYNAQLDRKLIAKVKHLIETYHKPVFIGESGLAEQSPVGTNITLSEGAPIGLRHSLWAAIVSGCMNGRSWWWEDGFAVFFPKSAGWPLMEKYAAIESSPANFVKDVDFTGYLPMEVSLPEDTSLMGGAVGNEKSVIGWFRDSQCEPPLWPMRETIAHQTVTITIPGTATQWQVDFYATAAGTPLVGSLRITRDSEGKGKSVTLQLPDFHDDIAFKMYAVQK